MGQDRGKAVTAAGLVAGLLLSCACMLFVCPVIAAAQPAESCHPAPEADSDPVSCPYTVVQPVYVSPALDRDFGRDADLVDIAGGETSVPQVAAGRSPWTVQEEKVHSPPGLGLYLRLCVLRI